MRVLETAIRIILSLFIGGIIGWERESSHRPAGMRTHMLVAVGSAAVMIIGDYSHKLYGGDATRLGAQVVSGIGFLGAGTILKEGSTIKGLTTAASVWAVACIGIAAGAGFYDVAVIGCLSMIAILTVFEEIENKIGSGKRTRLKVYLLCKDASKTLMHINRLMPSYDASLRDIIMDEITDNENGYIENYSLNFKIYTRKARRDIDYTEITAKICEIVGVSKVEIEEF